LLNVVVAGDNNNNNDWGRWMLKGAEGDDVDGVSVEYSPPRGKFERWAVECRKPQYQSPCSGFQKYECLFVDERWRMKKCRPNVHKNVPAKKKWCQCKALSKYRLSKLEPEERRMQRAFLKEHTRHVDWRGYRPRFLKTVAGKKKFHNRNNNRQKREESSPVTETVAASAEGSVLRDVAEDELEQVELIMEDISDEISDLEVSFNYFFLFCFVFFILVFKFNLTIISSGSNGSENKRFQQHGISKHPSGNYGPIYRGWIADE
jgi:hypothetical protein